MKSPCGDLLLNQEWTFYDSLWLFDIFGRRLCLKFKNLCVHVNLHIMVPSLVSIHAAVSEEEISEQDGDEKTEKLKLVAGTPLKTGNMDQMTRKLWQSQQISFLWAAGYFVMICEFMMTTIKVCDTSIL